MGVNRRAAKRDNKKGVPDLLVGYIDPFTGKRTNALMEVKDKKGKLTPDEETWITAWEGSVHIVRSIEEAFEVIGR
jgi:hypothetical protein